MLTHSYCVHCHVQLTFVEAMKTNEQIWDVGHLSVFVALIFFFFFLSALDKNEASGVGGSGWVSMQRFCNKTYTNFNYVGRSRSADATLASAELDKIF